MANIHGLEPHAHGLIVLKTTFGDLEVELFTQQCPRATRNFVQLCLDGYYDGTIFKRIEKDFIAVGGSLADDDESFDELQVKKFKDEFHTRLRFSRRGLLATANTQKDDNGCEFFLTLGPTPELQNKHTIFGRLHGNSIYFITDLNECQVDDDLVPCSEKRIIKATVVENPFPELHHRSEFARIKKNEVREEQEEEEFIDPLSKPKPAINKKLSFYHTDSDEGDDDELDHVEPNGQKQTEQSETADLKLERESKLNFGQSPTSDTCVRPKLESNCNKVGDREERLRAIRAQIQDIKSQIENEPETPMKISQRRSRCSAESKSNGSRSESSRRSDLDLNSSKELRIVSEKGRRRERETLELIHNFKKKLKEKSSSLVDEAERKQPAVDDSPRLLNIESLMDNPETLEKVDGDAWLHHRFGANDYNESRFNRDENPKADDLLIERRSHFYDEPNC